MKKGGKRFAEGRTSPYHGPMRGRPLTNDLAEAICFMLKERPCLSCRVLCRHFRIAKGTYLRILHDTLGMKKFQLCWVSHALDTNQKADWSLYHREFFRYYRAFVLLVSRGSLEMNHGFFCIIPVIRYGNRHEMKSQRESLKKLTQKSVKVHFFRLSMESTALLMF
jgi:hypothetical protein